jgi:hypothetical protein
VKGKIFVIDEQEKLRELVETPYATEDLLQQLLARYPDLLAGDQMRSTAPRRWLLVSREVEVADSEEGVGRWALDHLFLDQDGIPTLVEVKRSSDTRIRREVVGQMLDYAANGLAYWPLEKLRSLFEADCARLGLEPEARLRAHLDAAESDTEAFWQAVKTNLQAGRVRLVFLADVIPPELRRVVEFLNTQMDPAEVLAVGVRQYEGGGIRTLVPQVFGLTAEAEARKGGSTARPRWNEERLFAAIRELGEPAHRAARHLYDWSLLRLPDATWGKGSIIGSYFPGRTIAGVRHLPFALWTTGDIELQFARMKAKPPFDQDDLRRELQRRIEAVPGVTLPPDAIDKQPNLKMGAVSTDGALRRLEEAFEWYLEVAETHAQRAAASAGEQAPTSL